jgi:hypothetical protein
MSRFKSLFNKTIVETSAPAPAPTKPGTRPTTRPDTKPGTTPRPRHPLAPRPGQQPRPMALKNEEEESADVKLFNRNRKRLSDSKNEKNKI